jgi:hypothetical protein
MKYLFKSSLKRLMQIYKLAEYRNYFVKLLQLFFQNNFRLLTASI